MTKCIQVDCTRRYNCRNGLPTTYLNGNTPAQRYQRLKIIQNTVRVPSSVYTMNLGALNVYQAPEETYGVNWNQMSDRKEAHEQKANASGSNPGGNSTRRTITRLRPGALSPGGVGVDIKHNSYARYLARLQGKKPLRQEQAPATFSNNNIPFNQAYPVYGGKLFKTGIVAGCVCKDDTASKNIIYDNRGDACAVPILVEPNDTYTNQNCLCPPEGEAPKNQYYGYSSSDSFLLQCTQNIKCGDIVPVL